MNETSAKQNGDYFYLRFKGPNADNGMLDLGKASKVLYAINRWAKKYKKECVNNIDFALKIGGIKRGSTELQIMIELIEQLVSTPVAQVAIPSMMLANIPGIKDFIKSFGKTIGEQLALKCFAKGKNLRESDLRAKKGKIVVDAVNIDNERKEVEKKDLDFYRKSNDTLDDLFVLEEGKENTLEMGTVINGKSSAVATLSVTEKNSFVKEYSSDDMERRMNEGFDDEKATEERIVGQFVEFHGLAYKYRFSFQARKEQDKYGKQKILCVVDDNKTSEILDLLKPENKKNICIHGMAVKDFMGKLDKIKIDWFNENPDYNPNQMELSYGTK
ncbi:MAG: hypothetical protein LBQ02_03490 [Candidatus Nomurabacteria bacterium]|jgi:hypothetical protein|nr:hypothetical protein [Candidatus Nomurabacteria bacterium]